MKKNAVPFGLNGDGRFKLRFKLYFKEYNIMTHDAF